MSLEETGINNKDDNDYNNDYNNGSDKDESDNEDEIRKIISDEVESQLSFFHKKMEKIEKDNEKIENKLNLIIELLEDRIDKQCSKMWEHIDFFENVYENVKNPLGYLCNKVGSFIGKNESYTLDNVKSTKPQLTDLENKQPEEEYDTSSESVISYESE